MWRRFRWVLLALAVVLVGLVAAAAIVAKPTLDDDEQAVDARWADLRDALVPRYAALDGAVAALGAAGEGDRAVTQDLTVDLAAWKRALDGGSAAEQTKIANRLEGQAARLHANVLGADRLKQDTNLVGALATFDNATTPANLVAAYNGAVQTYEDDRTDTLRAPVALDLRLRRTATVRGAVLGGILPDAPCRRPRPRGAAMPDQPSVDPSNADAFAAWNGNEGDYWAAHEDYFARSLLRYDEVFFAAASIAPADRVLDVGCGTGSTTRAAAQRATSGDALGIDLSSQMLARARARAAADGVTNVSFLQADAQVHPFDEGAFDAAISRTGTMFFANPVAAFSNIGRALRPGGRFVQLVWQGMPENEWFVAFRDAVVVGPGPPGTAAGCARPVRIRRSRACHLSARLGGIHRCRDRRPCRADGTRAHCRRRVRERVRHGLRRVHASRRR